MPAFIKTPADEQRWKKAKEAAGKTLSESDGDRFWALTNSIYQKMSKSEELEKARRKMSDEYDPYEDEQDNDLGEGFSEINPDEESSADDWLKENDPDYGRKGDSNDYMEYDSGEDEDAHQQSIDEDYGAMAAEDSEEGSKGSVNPKSAAQASIKPEDSEEEVEGKKGRFRQPSRDELVGLRAYTRPWEQRAREATKLQADPSKNPVLAHQGEIIEAREGAHRDRKKAYQDFVNSDEYKNADPITQMEMDDKFESDWRTQNPTHLGEAMQAHQEAHQKGKEGHAKHAAAKAAQIQNVLTGGAQSPEAYSTQEGLQHVGGSKGEEGYEGTIIHDPASSFAMGNQDFIRQYAEDYNKKGKKPTNIDDMMDYDEGSQKDIGRILGQAQTKDPRFEQFFAHYHPLIGMNAHRTLKRLGLDPKSPDIDMSMLHEAGMHGLVQAINDYDHDNPSKASFATHASNKIRGLQMTAMKNIDKIPTELRQAQKKFAAGKSSKDLMSHPSYTKGPDVSDRMKRVDAQRQAQVIRRKSTQPKPITAPISIPKIETDEGEE